MARRCILGVFAHPDDETSNAGGSFTRFARDGVEVHVLTATRGENGTLGTGGLSILREELPSVREEELRGVLQLYGAQPPILLDYVDQMLKEVNFEGLVEEVVAVMDRVRPDVVITFGPHGISRHDDHVAIHKAAVGAFHQYRLLTDEEPRLFYTALPKKMADGYGLGLDGPEVEPTALIDITQCKAIKIQALRMYRSQEDAQRLAEMMETPQFDAETFHQAYPPVPTGHMIADFWG